MKKIVQCPACRNFESLSNIYCRICGEKLPDANRERIEKAGPWILMLLGILSSLALGLRRNDSSGAFLILCFSFCSILFSHGIFRTAERILWYRKPLLSRLLPAQGLPRKDGEHLLRLHEKRNYVSVFDRNVGLLLSTLSDKNRLQDDGRVLGHVKKAIRFYERNAVELVELLGKERYEERVEFFKKTQKLIFENTLMAKNDRERKKYDKIIRVMIEEIERKESAVDLDRDLLMDRS